MRAEGESASIEVSFAAGADKLEVTAVTIRADLRGGISVADIANARLGEVFERCAMELMQPIEHGGPVPPWPDAVLPTDDDPLIEGESYIIDDHGRTWHLRPGQKHQVVALGTGDAEQVTYALRPLRGGTRRRLDPADYEKVASLYLEAKKARRPYAAAVAREFRCTPEVARKRVETARRLGLLAAEDA